MKKLLAILLMAPAIAFSQSKEIKKQHEVVCLNWNSISLILDKYDEDPLVRGMSLREDGKRKSQEPLVLFVNAKTFSWTIIEKVGNDLYCVLAIGNGFEAVPGNIIDDMRERRKKFGV